MKISIAFPRSGLGLTRTGARHLLRCRHGTCAQCHSIARNNMTNDTPCAGTCIYALHQLGHYFRRKAIGNNTGFDSSSGGTSTNKQESNTIILINSKSLLYSETACQVISPIYHRTTIRVYQERKANGIFFQHVGCHKS